MDFHTLTDGWKELESDPGLFTLLLEDFGVKGVQVEEVYDLHKPFDEDHIFGFIFLFRWSKESRRESRASSRAVNRNNPLTSETTDDNEKVNRMFFAAQIVPNSCATHALISVLLNCPTIELGETLTELKVHTNMMSPENKGYAISNCSRLAAAHNRHASRHVDAADMIESAGSASGLSRFGRLDPAATNELSKSLAQFHFVSYVPIDGHLYELDGLKSAPFDHGPWQADEQWTDLMRRVILARIKNDVDIRYSLMSVVPDKRLALIKRLKELKTNRHVIYEALKKLVTDFRLPSPSQNHNYFNGSPTTEPTEPTEPLEDSDVRKEEDTVKTEASFRSHSQSSRSSTSSRTETCSHVGSHLSDDHDEHQSLSAENVMNDKEPPISKFIAFKLVPEENEKKSQSTGPVGPGGDGPKQQANPQQRQENSGLTQSKVRGSALDLLTLMNSLEKEIEVCESHLRNELEKRAKYRQDDERRTFCYDQFLHDFIALLAHEKLIPELCEQELKDSHNSLGSGGGGGTHCDSPVASARLADHASEATDTTRRRKT